MWFLDEKQHQNVSKVIEIDNWKDRCCLHYLVICIIGINTYGCKVWRRWFEMLTVYGFVYGGTFIHNDVAHGVMPIDGSLIAVAILWISMPHMLGSSNNVHVCYHCKYLISEVTSWYRFSPPSIKSNLRVKNYWWNLLQKSNIFRW